MYVSKKERVLKLWRMINLTVTMSKIMHLSLVTNVSTEIINELNKIQKELI